LRGAATRSAPAIESGRARILLTNDDGVDARGLETLRGALAGAARRYDVTVVAPASDRSGSSMSKTRGDLSAVRRSPGVYAVSGTPSDCVAAALSALVEPPVDLVVSGMNSGANLGRVALTSGTVGAAMTAASMGARAIAVSVGSLDGDDPAPSAFADAAELTLRLVDAVLARPELLPPGTVLSVNYPARPRAEIRGVRVVAQSPVLPKVRRFRSIDGGRRGHDARRIVLERRRSRRVEDLGPADADLAAFRDGWVTVTPMDGDWTAAPMLAPLSERLRGLEGLSPRP
jgi:5'-nucleotidase